MKNKLIKEVFGLGFADDIKERDQFLTSFVNTNIDKFVMVEVLQIRLCGDGWKRAYGIKIPIK
ncbi:MAG: hypothetical protein ACYDDE_00560 [bacterium]